MSTQCIQQMLKDIIYMWCLHLRIVLVAEVVGDIENND